MTDPTASWLYRGAFHPWPWAGTTERGLTNADLKFEVEAEVPNGMGSFVSAGWATIWEVRGWVELTGEPSPIGVGEPGSEPGVTPLFKREWLIFPLTFPTAEQMPKRDMRVTFDDGKGKPLVADIKQVDVPEHDHDHVEITAVTYE